MPLKPVSKPLGMPFIELQSVDSTNKHAMGLIHEELATHGMTVFAHEQTAGKGQRGKGWESGIRQNLSISIIADPHPLMPSEVFKLSICTAVSLLEIFKKHAGDESRIKWPNDIYWRDSKAGGILIENVIRGQEPGIANWKWSVIGIGLNINQTSFPANLPNPVSLKKITGKDHDIMKLSSDLCAVLNTHFEELINGKFELLFEKYLQSLYKINQEVTLRKDNRVFKTIIKGVSKEGRLLTKHAIEESFEFGEVELIFEGI